MKILKNIGDGILKSIALFKPVSCDVFECFGQLKCKSEELDGDNLKRQLAQEQAERDERLFELLKQIEENTR